MFLLHLHVLVWSIQGSLDQWFADENSFRDAKCILDCQPTDSINNYWSLIFSILSDERAHRCSSSTGHSLKVFRVPSPLHFDLRGGAIDLTEIV